MARPSRFSPKVRERVVQMVFEHTQAHASQWADDHVNRREDRVRGGDAASLGAAGRGLAGVELAA